MHDEEYLRQAHVGELKPRTAPIVVAAYDPAWPEAYEREASRIRAALGEAALVVEHVGSTSVPGLAAKPILDIVLAVPDSSEESAYVRALESAGYRLEIREPGWHEHRLLKGPSDSVNLHVFSRECPEIGRMLLFRDWLRAHPEDRDLYARTKHELAQKEWKYTQNYADAKTEVVAAILERASRAR